jgi:hypothetical protein
MSRRRPRTLHLTILLVSAAACGQSAGSCVNAANQVVDDSLCRTTSGTSHGTYHFVGGGNSGSNTSGEATDVIRGGFGEAGEAHGSGGE